MRCARLHRKLLPMAKSTERHCVMRWKTAASANQVPWKTSVTRDMWTRGATQPLAPMLANAFHAHDDSGTSVSDHDPLIVDLKAKGRISRVFDSLRRVGRGSTTSGSSPGNG